MFRNLSFWPCCSCSCPKMENQHHLIHFFLLWRCVQGIWIQISIFISSFKNPAETNQNLVLSATIQWYWVCINTELNELLSLITTVLKQSYTDIPPVWAAGCQSLTDQELQYPPLASGCSAEVPWCIRRLLTRFLLCSETREPKNSETELVFCHSFKNVLHCDKQGHVSSSIESASFFFLFLFSMRRTNTSTHEKCLSLWPAVSESSMQNNLY